MGTGTGRVQPRVRRRVRRRGSRRRSGRSAPAGRTGSPGRSGSRASATFELGDSLDPFSNQADLAFHREVGHPRDQCLACRVAVDPADEPDVELHQVGAELKDMAKAGVASPGVVDRQPNRRPKARELGPSAA